MRARLAKAAFEIVALRGHSNLRTAAVAERAGVSSGALLHHFPNKDAVTLAAIEYAFGRAGAASRKRASQPYRDARALLRALRDDLAAFFHGDDFWVALDITMDASKSPTLKAAIRHCVEQHRAPVYAGWSKKLHEWGWSADDAALVVRGCAALASGAAIRTLWTKSDEVTERLAEDWEAQALALARAPKKRKSAQ